MKKEGIKYEKTWAHNFIGSLLGIFAGPENNFYKSF